MDKIANKIQHCSCCGRQGKDLHLDSNGYTECCGKCTCGGDATGMMIGLDTYGSIDNPEKRVKACCIGMSDIYFDKKGIKQEKNEEWGLVD